MDIWPHRETASRLPRVFPLLGRHDDSDRSAPARRIDREPESRTSAAARHTNATDREVQPAGGLEVGSESSRSPRATRKPAGQQSAPDTETADLLPMPIAVNLPIKLHERPLAEGDVALQVSPYDLPPLSNQAEGEARELSDSPVQSLTATHRPEPSALEAPVRTTPRREEHLVPAAAGANSESALPDSGFPQGGSQAPQPPSPSPAPPIERFKETLPPRTSQPPGPAGRPPSTKTATPRAMP
jgi:hypothetical protein